MKSVKNSIDRISTLLSTIDGQLEELLSINGGHSCKCCETLRVFFKN